LLSHVNIGIRHVLPIFLLLAGLAGAGAAGLLKASPRWAACGVLLMLACLASSIAAHPDYLTYFSELLDGNSGRYGLDSDLDWGQDLERLRLACERRHVRQIAIQYHGSADPHRFLPFASALNPDSRPTGWVAISVFKLKLGLENRPYAFEWLDKLKPVEFVGNSIRLYYIESPIK
jgi:hypothetical protein